MDNKKQNPEDIFAELNHLPKEGVKLSKEDVANISGGQAVILCPLCGSPRLTFRALPGGAAAACNSCGHVFRIV